MYTQTRKRLSATVTDHVHEKLLVAAELLGATLDQFIVLAALEKAEKLIASESTIHLTQREAARLLALLENPPQRTDHFKKLMMDYQQVNDDGSDSTVEWSPQ